MRLKNYLSQIYFVFLEKSRFSKMIANNPQPMRYFAMTVIVISLPKSNSDKRIHIEMHSVNEKFKIYL